MRTTDLARAPRHRERDHAIEADRRQQRAEPAKGGGEHGADARRHQARAHVLLHRRIAHEHQARLHGEQLAAHGGE